MSSASPGRYQSRLFNFLNRQSLRLVDQCDRAVRHLKVATVWGVQILLYPVYLLAQATLSAGRQLSNSAQAGWPQLKAFTPSPPQDTPPASDTPIQRVLGEVSTLELPVTELNVGMLAGWNVQHSQSSTEISFQPATAANLSAESNASTTQNSQLKGENLIIQGVATLLTTRTLVLVTVQNQILDILTPQQQQKLSSRISWEVADLLRQWRLVQALDSKPTQRRLSALDQPRLFLPVRLFWQLMAWVQTSPVAIATNLFQEVTLVHSPTPEASHLQPSTFNLQPSTFNRQPSTFNLQPSQPSTPIHEALAFLDHTIAELESHQLVPGTEVVVALSENVTRSLRDRTQRLLQQLQTQITLADQSKALDASQTHKFGIQALIYAAVDYFFGRHQPNLPQTDYQKRSPILTDAWNSPGEVDQLSGCDSTSLPKHPKLPAQLPEPMENNRPRLPGTSVWSIFKRHPNLNQPLRKLAQASPKSGVQITQDQTGSPTTASSPHTSIPPTTEAPHPHPLRIQALIYAAINYFFGRSPVNLLGTGSQAETPQLLGDTPASFPPVGLSRSDCSDATEADLWLTWSDLYGNSDLLESAQPLAPSPALGNGEFPKAKAQLPDAFRGRTPVKPGNNIWGVIKRLLNFKQPSGKLAPPHTGKLKVEPSKSVIQSTQLREGTVTPRLKTQSQPIDTTLTRGEILYPEPESARSTSISPTTTVSSSIATPASPASDTELEPAHEWIETRATPVGYVKHPLEQLLTWLDFGMLWIEEFAVKVWRWIRQLRA